LLRGELSKPQLLLLRIWQPLKPKRRLLLKLD
jgi:hypothetical protein